LKADLEVRVLLLEGQGDGLEHLAQRRRREHGQLLRLGRVRPRGEERPARHAITKETRTNVRRFMMCLRESHARAGGLVAGHAGDVLAKARARQTVEQRLHRCLRGQGRGKDQIEAGFRERLEVQPETGRGGSRGHAHIAQAHGHHLRHRPMPACDRHRGVVLPRAARLAIHAFQQLLRARAGFARDDACAFAIHVGDALVFLLGSAHEALFPGSQGDQHHGLRAEPLAHSRGVVAGTPLSQIGACQRCARAFRQLFQRGPAGLLDPVQAGTVESVLPGGARARRGQDRNRRPEDCAAAIPRRAEGRTLALVLPFWVDKVAMPSAGVPSARASSVSSTRATQRSATQPSDTRFLRASLGARDPASPTKLGLDDLSVAVQAEEIFHPAAQLARQGQGNLRGRDGFAGLDQTERLATDADGLGQILLLHAQPLPRGLDGGANARVHGQSIANPGPGVNLSGRKVAKVYELASSDSRWGA
jgi:hypothetical protein